MFGFKLKPSKYFITWKSPITKKWYFGTRPFSLNDATLQCNKLNSQFPTIRHKPKRKVLS